MVHANNKVVKMRELAEHLQKEFGAQNVDPEHRFFQETDPRLPLPWHSVLKFTLPHKIDLAHVQRVVKRNQYHIREVEFPWIGKGATGLYITPPSGDSSWKLAILHTQDPTRLEKPEFLLLPSSINITTPSELHREQRDEVLNFLRVITKKNKSSY